MNVRRASNREITISSYLTEFLKNENLEIE